jgi:hypothetical protein
MTLCAASTGAAQAVIAGRAVDGRLRPLAGAVVTVEGLQRRSVTDDSGRFTIAVVDSAGWLTVRRLGFLEVRQRYAAGDSIRVELREIPALLAGVSVDAPLAPPLAQTVTAASVRQAPALLEPDVFRALLLLPGVSQPNDLRGRVHLAGGAGDETAVRLDGHPLQDPFHLFGLIGAMNVGALDRATVSIHHLPLEAQGSLSGVISLDTRGVADSTEVTASVLAAGLTTSRHLPAQLDVLASGRMSYVKAVAKALYPDAVERGDLPLYDVRDGLLRLGRTFAGGARVETIAFTTADAFANPRLEAISGYRPLAWGETMAGASMRVPRGAWTLDLHTSATAWRLGRDERPARPDGDWIDVHRRILTISADAERRGDVLAFRTGVMADQRRFQQAWSVSGANDDVFSPRTPPAFAGTAGAWRVGGYSAFDANVSARTILSLGARLWGTRSGAYLAPQLLVARALTEDVKLELSAERRHQFDAELEEPVEGTVAAPRFLLDRPRVADVAAASLAWRPRRAQSSSELRLETFAKRYTRLPLLRDATLGEPVVPATAGFPQFEFHRGASAGIGVRGKTALASGVALQAAYTFQRALIEDDGEWFPSDGDIPHSFIGFASVPLHLAGLRLTTAAQFHSGAVITPVAARVLVPDAEFFAGFSSRFLSGGRNSFRLRPYQRIDLGLRRAWRAGRAEVALSAQVLNLLLRDNPRSMSWERYYELLSVGAGDAAARSTSGVPGLPILPSIGIEVRW